MASDPKRAPWALLPCALLALSSVSLLRPTHAAPPPPAPPAQAAYDDGDGDELLEHWGDPKYSREERLQMAGIAVLLAPLAALSWRRKAVRR